MTPLCIEFELLHAMVVPAMPIHLDALLAYAATEDVLAAGAQEKDKVRYLADPVLEKVLKKHFQDGEWVYMASALVPEGYGESSLRLWTRKTDPYDYSDRLEEQVASRMRFPPSNPYAMRVNTGSGLMKNHFNAYPLREVNKLVAWCIGDQEEIHDMLEAHIRFVGSWRRAGHGQVKSISVLEDQAAVDKWKMRVLPWQEEGALPLSAAVRPPYWAAENKRQAFCPPEILA